VIDSRAPASVGGLSRTGSAAARRQLGRALLYAAAVASSTAFLLPFLWAVLSSLKAPIEIRAYPPTLLPAVARWSNYAEVFERVPYGLWIRNTALVSVLATLGGVLSASLVAYSFARFRWPTRDLWFIVTLSTMMLPVEVTIIPLYIFFFRLGWIDTYYPLIVPSLFGGGGFLIFLMRQFFLTIPLDLDEAARIDGAGPLTIFWRILMPLSVPALATATVLTFIGHWEAFLGPLIFLNKTEHYTLALGLRHFQQQPSSDSQPVEHLLMAATLLMTAPIIALFFLAQRYLVRGIVMTGIKG
jgi:ABC-type glycerol-3-phosphate transport system permease component